MPLITCLLLSGLLTSLTTYSATASGSKTSENSISFEYPDGPTNLTAHIKVVVDAKNVQYISKKIELTLSWNRPQYDVELRGYNLVVNVTKHENNDICSTDFIPYHIQIPNPNITNVTIPHKEHGRDKKIIHRNCTYNVYLYSVPFPRPIEDGFFLRDKVHIPDCIEENCNCKVRPPPATDVLVSGLNNSPWEVMTTWKYKFKHQVRFFLVNYAKEVKSENAKKPIYKVFTSTIHNETVENKYLTQRKLTQSNRQKISVCVYDEYYCNSCADVFVECTWSGWCNCADNTLIAPLSVNTNQNESAFYKRIRWRYPKNQTNLNYFRLITYKDDYNGVYNDVYNVTAHNDFDRLDRNSSEFHTYSSVLPCMRASTSISIHAVNDKGCHGLPLKTKFNCLGEVIYLPHNTSTKGVIIGISMFFFCTLFVTGLVFIKRKRLTSFIAKKFRRTQGRYNQSIIGFSRNLIYVEKEIHEAREKGIVDEFEINYHRIELGKEIGKGAFGRVFVATIEALTQPSSKSVVAVKQLKEGASDCEKEDFIAEISMMKQVGKHPHVVTMLACCTMQQPYCMVMEYVPCGDLLHYLKKLRRKYVTRSQLFNSKMSLSNGHSKSHFSNECSDEKIQEYNSQSTQCNSTSTNMTAVTSTFTIPEEDENALETEVDLLIDRNSQPRLGYVQLGNLTPPLSPDQSLNSEWCCLDSRELHTFALQIARGMAHLSGKGITHRDLAARNVLIDEQKTLKISDFGLSRTGIYVTQRGGRVPLRWLSVEAISNNIYSMESDVWAFGVVLWEICTLGGFPYATVSDAALLQHLLNGNRLEKPDNCADEMYSIMEACWNEDPNFRPSFPYLCDLLDRMKDESHVYVNFDVITNRALPPSELQVNRTRELSSLSVLTNEG